MPFLSADKKISQISRNLPQTGIALVPVLQKENTSNLQRILLPPGNGIISALKAGNQQLHFDFSCPESIYRTVEVWQNGRMLNQTHLPIEDGSSSHPLPRNFQQDLPAQLKVWYSRKDGIKWDEKTVFFTYPENHNLIRFLKRICQSSENDQISPEDLISTDNILYCNLPESQQDNIAPTIVFESGTNSFSGTDRSLATNDNRRLFETSRKHESTANRFFLVENEFDLSRFNFDKLRIHLDQNRFYQNLIAAMFRPVANIETIVSETETRIARFERLSFTDQSTELEKIEGLLIPISEFILDPATNGPGMVSLRSRVKKLLFHLQNLIYLPPELQKLSSNERTLISIGPVSPLLDFSLSIDTINRSVKTGGKIRLKAINGDFPVNLNSRIVDFKNHSGSYQKIEKLMNLRTDPVLIELIFEESKLFR